MSIFKCNHVSYSYDKNTNVLKDITFSFNLKLVDCLEKCLIYGHIRRFAN